MNMVEKPGTAPGSKIPIIRSVYYYSWHNQQSILTQNLRIQLLKIFFLRNFLLLYIKMRIC
jgi:hypothetical protein